MKIIVDNLKSRLITDNPGLIKSLWEYYSVTRPDARWVKGSGKKRFFYKNGTFFTGLLSRVLNDLKRIGCEPELEYKVSPDAYIQHSLYNPFGEYNLYDYQSKTCDQALIRNRCIIKSPTGSGKTLMMASMLRALNYPKTLILFTQKHLVNQTYEFFKKLGIDCGYCTGEGYLPGKIMLATVQSLDRVVENFIDCKCFMVDEAHEFSQSSDRETVINSFPDATLRFAFTATVPSDKIGLYRLEGAFGPVLELVTTADLIADKKLTEPIINIINMPNESTIYSSLSYDDLYERFIVKNAHRNNLIAFMVSSILKNEYKPKIAILVKSLDHLSILEDLIEGSFTIQGSDDIKSRYVKINAFVKEGGVLIGTKILQTGINIEEITHLFNARGLAKDIPTIQALGRALRKHESKDRVQIYDFMDTVKYLNAHSKKRKKHYINEGHKIVEI